jgi:Protein of unknown function (DUF2790)
MKTLLAVLLASVSAVSMAGEVQPKSASVEQYNYSTKLDIAKVISQTDVSSVCGTTPVEMTYLDSSGEQHSVQYLVVGGGCRNG